MTLILRQTPAKNTEKMFHRVNGAETLSLLSLLAALLTTKAPQTSIYCLKQFFSSLGDQINSWCHDFSQNIKARRSVTAANKHFKLYFDLIWQFGCFEISGTFTRDKIRTVGGKKHVSCQIIRYDTDLYKKILSSHLARQNIIVKFLTSNNISLFPKMKLYLQRLNLLQSTTQLHRCCGYSTTLEARTLSLNTYLVRMLCFQMRNIVN